MNNSFKTIIQHHEMIDIIRSHKEADITVEEIKDRLAIARSTADRAFANLMDSENSLIIRDGKRATICGDKAFFLGISFGSLNTRFVLLGLDFEPVSLDSLCGASYTATLQRIASYNPSESDDYSYAFKNDDNNKTDDMRWATIRKTIDTILDIFLGLAEIYNEHNGKQGGIPLAGIGFGVTGPVNYAEKTWISTPRLNIIKDITIQDLIGYKNANRITNLGIFLSLDNNVKASAVSEYQFLMETAKGQYSNDVAVIYVGSGIGCATIIDGKLLRGSGNMSGELGHICNLGESESLEQCIETRISSLADLPEEQRIDKELEIYIDNLKFILKILNCVLGVDRFILVGHSIAKYNMLEHALMDNRFDFTVASTQQYCHPADQRKKPYTAAIGAAIESYYTMCNYRIDTEHEKGKKLSELTNLAQDISWR